MPLSLWTGVGGMGMARTGCHPTSHRQPHWRSRENRQNEPVSVSDKATDKQKSVIGVASVSALSKILLCSYIYDGWESEPTIYKKARALHSCTCTCTCTCTYILEAVWRGELFKKGPRSFFSPQQERPQYAWSHKTQPRSLSSDRVPTAEARSPLRTEWLAFLAQWQCPVWPLGSRTVLCC